MPVMPASSSMAQKSSRLRIEPGAVVEYEQHGKPLIAIVCAEKRNKWQVMNAAGQELDLDAARLYLFPPLRQEANSKQSRIAVLLELERQSAALQQTVDLEALWSTVYGETLEAPLDDLAELAFPQADTASFLALRRALLADTVFFKRKKTTFEPRDPETVEELKLKKLADEKRAAERGALMDALAERIRNRAGNTPLPQSVRILEEFAALGSKAQRSKEALLLLEELQSRGMLPAGGRSEERIMELLVSAGHFSADQNLSYLRLNRPVGFSETVLADAMHAVERIRSQLNSPARRALRDQYIVAIDSAETRDVDDALSLEVDPAGGYVLGIHISDVSAAVTSGSTLEDDALRRATSVYCPEGSVPMLPPLLSEGELSLLEGAERCCVSFFITFDHSFAPVKRTIERTRLTVSARLTYDQVDQILCADDSPDTTDLSAYTLHALWRIVTTLEARRIAAGALQFNRRELSARLNADGKVILVEAEDDTPARKLVSELMILANETGALAAGDRGVPLVFRGQEPPDVDLSTQRAVVPDGPAREFYLRSLLKRSTTTLEPQGHAGLGLSAYAQFTSPLRRMVDLVNQRQLVTHLEDKRLYYTKDDLLLLLGMVEAGLDEAQLIQRERNRYFLLKYLLQESIKEIDAVVVKVDGAKPLIELQGLGLMTLLNNARKGLRPGDRLRLRITSVDPRRDILVLAETT